MSAKVCNRSRQLYDNFLAPCDTFIAPNDTSLAPCDTFLTPSDTCLAPCGTLLAPCDTFPAPCDYFLSPFDTFLAPCEKFQATCDIFPTPSDTFPAPCDTFLEPCDAFLAPSDPFLAPDLEKWLMAQTPFANLFWISKNLRQNTQENKVDLFYFHRVPDIVGIAQWQYCSYNYKQINFWLISTEFVMWKLFDFAEVFLLNLQQKRE